MKNSNTLLKTIQKTIKTSKTSNIVKVLLLWFNKVAQLANLKPKQLIILLGLLFVSLATLGLGMIGGKREGFGTITELEELTKEKIRIIDAMNCAINNTTTDQPTCDTMRSKINTWFTNYINYLRQGNDFNIKNNMDISGNNNHQIYQIKNNTDISGTTRPKYIDDKDIASISSSDLTKYQLVYVYEKGRVDTKNYTTTGDNKIYKIRDETTISATMPKYIDNVPVLPATAANGTPSLTTYSLIDITVPINKFGVNSVDTEEASIRTYFRTVTDIVTNLTALNSKLNNLKKYAEDYVALMTTPSSNGIEGFVTGDVNLILNQGTRHTVTERDEPNAAVKRNVDPCDMAGCSGSGCSTSSSVSPLNCNGVWTNIGSCVNGSIQKKYSVTRNATNGGTPCDYAQDEVKTFSCTNTGAPINCIGSWTPVDTCSNGLIKKKYSITTNASNGGDVCDYAQNEMKYFECDEDQDVPVSITNPNLLLEYLNKIESDVTNSDKWKQLYITELKRRNDYIKYANLHNATYHNNSRTQTSQASQASQARQSTQGYASLTGTGKVGGNVPPGDEHLYMLKSRMVPPTNPPGSGMNNTEDQESQKECSSSNGCSKPASVPPCPPCERCPEPAFDCKRVPNYNSVTSNHYLPRPVLTDFSQFGM